MTPEERAEHVFDAWYADAASFTGPTARRTCIAANAAAIRTAVKDATQEMLDALRLAQEDTCSLHCPSVKKTGEEWRHVNRCKTISVVIAKVEADIRSV